MAKKQTLTFLIESKKILNSNSMPSHFIVKGNMVAVLRKLGAEIGVEVHEGENRKEAERKLGALTSEANHALMKKRYKAKLKKKGGMTEAEMVEAAEKAYEDEKPEVASKDILVEPLFHKFTMKVTVFPPTARRIDPPNLYPTVKALTDGLTDASFWDDDDFNHLVEMSFRYGGVSGVKGMFRLELEIEEVEEN